MKPTSKSFWIFCLICILSSSLKFLETCLIDLVSSLLLSVNNCWSNPGKHAQVKMSLKSLKILMSAYLNSVDRLPLKKTGWDSLPSSARLISMNSLLWSFRWSCNWADSPWSSVLASSPAKHSKEYAIGPREGSDSVTKHKVQVVRSSGKRTFYQEPSPWRDLLLSFDFCCSGDLGDLVNIEAELSGLSSYLSRSSYDDKVRIEIGLSLCNFVKA